MIYCLPRCESQKLDHDVWFFFSFSSYRQWIFPDHQFYFQNVFESAHSCNHYPHFLSPRLLSPRLFLMGLPISRVTTFQSTHWTAARVCFLNNKSNLVVHTIKILQWISATYSMKIQTPKHRLQRLVLIWLLCLSSATQDYPPWTSLSLASCNALLGCYGFSHAVSRPGTAFLFYTPKYLLIVQVAPVLGSSSFAPLWVFWITIS